MKISPINRVMLLVTGLLAAYQIAVGIEGQAANSVICYTIAFGTLLVAGLLLLILGFEILENPFVVIVSTIIPLSLSFGLVEQFLPHWMIPYLIFTLLGFGLVVLTRFMTNRKAAVFVLAVTHGVSGLVIFALPFIMVWSGETRFGFSLVGIGGALIGVGGLLLSFLRAGKPVLSRETILTLLPGLLFWMTAAFVLGFAFA